MMSKAEDFHCHFHGYTCPAKRSQKHHPGKIGIPLDPLANIKYRAVTEKQIFGIAERYVSIVDAFRKVNICKRYKSKKTGDEGTILSFHKAELYLLNKGFKY
jgi:hypothetical protein